LEDVGRADLTVGAMDQDKFVARAKKAGYRG
jgi:hypothetical protein